MTEQIHAADAPTSVQAITAGTDTEIEEDEMRILSTAFAGSTSNVNNSVPSTNPSLQSFVSMGAITEMENQYKRENKLLAVSFFVFFNSLLAGGSNPEFFTGIPAVPVIGIVYYALLLILCVFIFIHYWFGRFRSEMKFRVYLNY